MPALLRSPRVHTLLIAIGALIVYWVLRAASFYGDGSALLFKVARGETAWLNHPLFLPLVGRLARLLARPGLPLFDAMSLLSATGAALFAASAHRAGLRLGLAPSRAAVLALLCIATPVVVTLATVVEVPGPYLGAAGPALWLAVHLVRTPRFAVAMLLGCTTGLAHGLHASGAFLLPGLMVLLVCERRAAHLPRPYLRTLVDLLIAGGSHLAFLCTAIAVLRPGLPIASLWHSETLDQALRQMGSLPAWHRVLLIEWGVPFAPLSLVPVLALLIRTSNPVRIALWGLTVPALVVNTLIFREAATHGTYLIPLVFPCALWTARKLPIPLGIAIALATIPVTARNFETLQNRAAVGLTQSMVADAVGDHSISAIVGEPAEAVPIVRHAPKTPWFLAESFLRNFPGYEQLCAAFRAAATDSELYLTPGALEVLRGATDPVVVRFVREEFDKHYLEECLRALLRQDPAPAEVLLVDNHSTDGSREFVAERFPSVQVLDTGDNRGPCAARNLGLAAARHDTVLLLDNDVVLLPGALASLHDRLASEPRAAVVQARSLCADEPSVLHYDAADLHYLGTLVLHGWFGKVAEARTEAAPVGAFVALCVLCDRRAVLAAGGFCERMFILYEDNQLSWKLRLAGRTVWHEPRAVCLHKGGTAGLSVRGPGASYPARRTFLHTRNRALLVRTCMSLRTLVVTWPARALYGLVQFAFAVGRGHLFAWLRAQWELVRLLPETLRERRTIQRTRTVADRELLVAAPLSLNPGIATRGLAAVVRRTLDAIFVGYWRVVRGVAG